MIVSRDAQVSFFVACLQFLYAWMPRVGPPIVQLSAHHGQSAAALIL